jgi:hypothetical protein
MSCTHPSNRTHQTARGVCLAAALSSCCTLHAPASTHTHVQVCMLLTRAGGARGEGCGRCVLCSLRKLLEDGGHPSWMVA